MKKVILVLCAVITMSFGSLDSENQKMESSGWCPENYVKIQSNCGWQCWTTVEVTPVIGGFGVIFTNREPTDAEAGIYQAYMNANCPSTSLDPVNP